MTHRPRRPRLIAVLLAAVAMVASMLLAAPAQAAGETITGVVTDKAGKRIAGATVFVGESETSGAIGVQTKSDGRYTTSDSQYLRNLAPGRYWVSVSSPWSPDAAVYEMTGAWVTVQQGQTVTKDFSLRQLSTKTFTVLDPAGKPVANAPVGIQVFYQGAWGGIQSGPNCTDSRGRYRFVESSMPAKAYFGGATRDGCVGPHTAPIRTDLIGQYWDNATGYANATVIDLRGPLQITQHTIRLKAAPSVVGTSRAGKTLRAQPGSWAPSGYALSYRWFASGKAISGATKSTFKPTNRQAGKRLAVRVTGTAPGKPTISRTSAQSAVVQGTLTARRPTVKGTAAKGKKLTAKVTAWSPKKVTLRYQWLRNGKRIKGATSRTYRVKSADVGKRITVRVTGSKKHFVTRTSTSKKTAKVRR